MAYVKIRPRRSTAPEWEYDNPILAEGEMGIEVPNTGVGTGYVKVKFGDGVTPWVDLPYGLVGGTISNADTKELEIRVSAIERFLENIRPKLVLTGAISQAQADQFAYNSEEAQAIANSMDSDVEALTVRVGAIESELATLQTVLLLIDDTTAIPVI